MAMKALVEGHLTQDPVVRFTPSGKQVLQLDIGCTASHRDKQTNEWVSDGDPLFVRADFWGEGWEWLAEVLEKGDKVAVSGTVIRRDYTTRDGLPNTAIGMRFPSLLGYVKKGARQAAQPGGGTQGSYSAPQGGAPGDSWGVASGDEPPF